MNVFPDIFFLLEYFREKEAIYVDFKSINFIDFIIPIGKMITFSDERLSQCIETFFQRIKVKAILSPVPNFIYASYSCFFFYLMRYPCRTDLVYPFSIDLQRLQVIINDIFKFKSFKTYIYAIIIIWYSYWS